jgi:hypothetical protein
VSATSIEQLPPVAPQRAARPITAVIVAMLALGLAAYTAVSGALALRDAVDTRDYVDACILLALGAGALVIAVGIFAVQRWAWAAFMTWAAVGLTLELLRHFFFDGANYVDLALYTIAVLALTPLDVQIAFRVRPPRNVELGRQTRNPIDRD